MGIKKNVGYIRIRNKFSMVYGFLCIFDEIFFLLFYVLNVTNTYMLARFSLPKLTTSKNSNILDFSVKVAPSAD